MQRADLRSSPPTTRLAPSKRLGAYLDMLFVDHGIFRVHGVPYLFLSCGRWAHYHQPTDTPDRLNYKKIGRIRDYVVRLTEALNRTVLLPLDRPGREEDTTAFEIALLHEALGEKGVQFLMAVIGLSRLATSAHLDALASRLQAYFEL